VKKIEDLRVNGGTYVIGGGADSLRRS